MRHLVSVFNYIAKRLGYNYFTGIIFLKDTLSFAAFINISCEIYGFPAGNARAPAGKKTAWCLDGLLEQSNAEAVLLGKPLLAEK